jgi:hypothetical protein
MVTSISFTGFQSDGQDEIHKAVALHGTDGAGGEAALHLKHDLLVGAGLERVKQVAVVKADLNRLTALGDNELVIALAHRGDAGQLERSALKKASDGSFESFGYNDGNTLNSPYKLALVKSEGNRLALGHCGLVIDEVTLQQTGKDCYGVKLKEGEFFVLDVIESLTFAVFDGKIKE